MIVFVGLLIVAFVPVIENCCPFIYYYQMQNIISFNIKMSELLAFNPREQFLLKLDDPSTTLEQLLAWDRVVEEYKQGEPKVHLFINNHLQRLIQIMTIEGHEQDKLRSFLFPQIVCEILCSGHPTMNLLLLTPLNSHINSQPLFQVLDYFQGTPNSVLSGYVVKVLASLYKNEPIKTQDYIFKRKYANEMIKFLSSGSVADFLVSLIAIDDDKILTYYINQRNQLLSYLADVYSEGKLGEDELVHLGGAIYQIINKLWSNKCKQIGQFVTTIFKIAQLILDNTNDLLKYNNDLLPLVVQKISSKEFSTPFLLRQTASRIIFVLSTYEPEVLISPAGKQTLKFSKQNLKLLTALSTIVKSNYGLVAEILKNSGCFAMLLDLMKNYQLNNMVHIEVEKIFKTALLSENPIAFSGIFQNGKFLTKFNELVLSQIADGQKGKKGYMGSLDNILGTLRQVIHSSRIFGQLTRSNPDFVNALERYISPKLQMANSNLGGCRLKVQYSLPEYDSKSLQEKYKRFFESEKISKDPRFSVDNNRQILNQILTQCQVNRQWGQKAGESREIW